MLEREQYREQRQSKRHLLCNGSYAIIKQQNYSEVAQLVDISNSGVSFLCLNEGDWSKEPFYIDLTGTRKALGSSPEDNILQSIPLHPLAYCADNCTRQNPFSFMQKCGVKFGELTLEQKIKLNEFISENSVEHFID